MSDENLKCKITNNICGTDTWEINYTCPCDNCQKYLGNDIILKEKRIVIYDNRD